MNWVQVVRKEYECEIIATGEKTVRGHFKGGGKALPGVVESGREVKGERAVERHHFISGLPAAARQFAKAVRSH